MKPYGSIKIPALLSLLLVSLPVIAASSLGLNSCAGNPSMEPSGEMETALPADAPKVLHAMSGTSRFQYLLTLPRVSPGGGHPPLIVFLHSLEERGGPLELLLDNPDGQGLGLAGYASARPDFPFATLSPLCPRLGYWTFMHRRLAALINEIVEEYHLDPERVYLAGVSMGGMGTWSLGMARPDLFKALAPIAGPVYSPPIRPRYGRLGALPVFAFHDRLDPSIPFALAETSVEKLNLHGGNGRLAGYDTGRHYIQDLVFADGRLFEWLLTLPDSPQDE